MNLLLPDSGLIFWMTIIFAIVFFILARFGFPVITGMVEKRNRRIADSLEAARIAEEALGKLTEEKERIIAQTRLEQEALKKEAALERDRMLEDARLQARTEAGKMLDEARLRIEEQKQAALRDIRAEVARLSIAVAEKVVRKEVASDKGQMEFIERMTGEMSDKV